MPRWSPSTLLTLEITKQRSHHTLLSEDSEETIERLEGKLASAIEENMALRARLRDKYHDDSNEVL
jgi:hypothetical protein